MAIVRIDMNSAQQPAAFREYDRENKRNQRQQVIFNSLLELSRVDLESAECQNTDLVLFSILRYCRKQRS